MSDTENQRKILIQGLTLAQAGKVPDSPAIDTLQQLSASHPYSSVIRVLKLLSVLSTGERLDEELLMLTALSVQDRKHLKDLAESLVTSAPQAESGLLTKPDPANSIREARDRILEEFLKKEPRMTSDPEATYDDSDDLAMQSMREDPALVSETLARIYALQGNLSKAKRIYERLSLKYPEKSAYFAALISGLDSQGHDQLYQ